MDVVGIDIPVVDFLVSVDKIPQTNSMAHLDDLSWQGGGKVSTAFAALGRLDVETGMIAVLGDDHLGRFCIEDFRRHNVDTSNIIVEPGRTSTFCICLAESETQGRSIIARMGTCRRLSVDDLNRDYIVSAKVLHLSHMCPASRQAAIWAREAGMKVVFDADYFHPEVIDNLELIDVFIASEFFYKSMYSSGSPEENFRHISSRGPEAVVVTLGEKGCMGLGDGIFFKTPAFKVKVVDTTGAGDVFHGAYIYGMLKGWSPEEAVRFSSAVSAIKCTRIGGRAGIPDLKTVKRFLEDGFIDYSDIDRRVEFYREQPWAK